MNGYGNYDFSDIMSEMNRRIDAEEARERALRDSLINEPMSLGSRIKRNLSVGLRETLIARGLELAGVESAKIKPEEVANMNWLDRTMATMASFVFDPTFYLSMGVGRGVAGVMVKSAEKGLSRLVGKGGTEVVKALAGSSAGLGLYTSQYDFIESLNNEESIKAAALNALVGGAKGAALGAAGALGSMTPIAFLSPKAAPVVKYAASALGEITGVALGLLTLYDDMSISDAVSNAASVVVAGKVSNAVTDRIAKGLSKALDDGPPPAELSKIIEETLKGAGIKAPEDISRAIEAAKSEPPAEATLVRPAKAPELSTSELIRFARELDPSTLNTERLAAIVSYLDSILGEFSRGSREYNDIVSLISKYESEINNRKGKPFTEVDGTTVSEAEFIEFVRSSINKEEARKGAIIEYIKSIHEKDQPNVLSDPKYDDMASRTPEELVSYLSEFAKLKAKSPDDASKFTNKARDAASRLQGMGVDAEEVASMLHDMSGASYTKGELAPKAAKPKAVKGSDALISTIAKEVMSDPDISANIEKAKDPETARKKLVASIAMTVRRALGGREPTSADIESVLMAVALWKGSNKKNKMNPRNLTKAITNAFKESEKVREAKAKPEGEVKPEEARPKPEEEVKPTEEAKPVEETRPVEEAKPEEVTKPSEEPPATTYGRPMPSGFLKNKASRMALQDEYKSDIPTAGVSDEYKALVKDVEPAPAPPAPPAPSATPPEPRVKPEPPSMEVSEKKRLGTYREKSLREVILSGDSEQFDTFIKTASGDDLLDSYLVARKLIAAGHKEPETLFRFKEISERLSERVFDGEVTPYDLSKLNERGVRLLALAVAESERAVERYKGMTPDELYNSVAKDSDTRKVASLIFAHHLEGDPKKGIAIAKGLVDRVFKDADDIMRAFKAIVGSRSAREHVSQILYRFITEGRESSPQDVMNSTGSITLAVERANVGDEITISGKCSVPCQIMSSPDGTYVLVTPTSPTSVLTVDVKDKSKIVVVESIKPDASADFIQATKDKDGNVTLFISRRTDIEVSPFSKQALAEDILVTKNTLYKSIYRALNEAGVSKKLLNERKQDIENIAEMYAIAVGGNVDILSGLSITVGGSTKYVIEAGSRTIELSKVEKGKADKEWASLMEKVMHELSHDIIEMYSRRVKVRSKAEIEALAVGLTHALIEANRDLPISREVKLAVSKRFNEFTSPDRPDSRQAINSRSHVLKRIASGVEALGYDTSGGFMLRDKLADILSGRSGRREYGMIEEDIRDPVAMSWFSKVFGKIEQTLYSLADKAARRKSYAQEKEYREMANLSSRVIEGELHSNYQIAALNDVLDTIVRYISPRTLDRMMDALRDFHNGDDIPVLVSKYGGEIATLVSSFKSIFDAYRNRVIDDMISVYKYKNPHRVDVIDAALNYIKAGNPHGLNHVISMFSGTHKPNVIRRIYSELENIERWGIDNYVTTVMPGQYAIIIRGGKKAPDQVIGWARTAEHGKEVAERYVSKKGIPHDSVYVKYIDPAINYKADSTAPIDTFRALGAKFAAPFEKRKGALTELFFEAVNGQEFIEIMRFYIRSMEKKLTFDPFVREFNQKFLKAIDKRAAEALSDSIIAARGRYWFEDKLVDSIVRGTGTALRNALISMFGTDFGIKIGSGEPARASRILGDIRRYTNIVTLGYRPVSAAYNYASAVFKLIAKYSLADVVEAARWMKTPFGESVLAANKAWLQATYSITKSGLTTHMNILHPMGLFRASEKGGQKLAFSVGYLDAMKRGLKHNEACEEGRRLQRFITDVQVLSNSPALLRSPLAKLIGQYRGFLVTEIHFISSIVRDPAKFIKYFTLASSVGGLRFMMLTLKSLPILASIAGYSNLVRSMEDYFETTIPAAYRGVPGMLGLDMSGVVELNLPTAPEDWWGGVFLSKAVKLFKSTMEEASATGKFPSKAVEEWLVHLSPGGRNWANFIQWALNQYDRKEKDPNMLRDLEGALYYEVKGIEPLFMAMGATPARLSSQRTILRNMRENEYRERLKRSYIIEKAADAYSSGNAKEFRRWLTEAMNAGIDASSIRRRIELNELPPIERQILRSTKINRAEYLETLRRMKALEDM